MVFLSLKKPGPSWISVAAGLQVAPPSVDRLASIALTDPGWKLAPVVDRLIAWITPSLPKLTHGSVARV